MSEASQGAHPAGAKAAPGGALPISQEARQEGLRLVLRVFGAFLLMLAIGVSMLAGPDEWLSQSEVEQKIEKIAQGMPDAASKAFEAIDLQILPAAGAATKQSLHFSGKEASPLVWTQPKLFQSRSFGDTVRTSVLARSQVGQLFLIDFEISTNHLIQCAEEPGDCLIQTGFQVISDEQAQQWMLDRPEFNAQVFETVFGRKSPANMNPA